MASFRKFLRAKIHRATVTESNLEYEGSLTIPPDLLAAAEIAEYEAIHVWNVTQGTRFETYALRGVPGFRGICVNGAAAHLASPGDIIIIAAFGIVDEAQAKTFKPKAIFVDENNRIVEQRLEEPARAAVK